MLKTSWQHKVIRHDWTHYVNRPDAGIEQKLSECVAVHAKSFGHGTHQKWVHISDRVIQAVMGDQANSFVLKRGC